MMTHALMRSSVIDYHKVYNILEFLKLLNQKY